jgi:hypothetical protein
MLFAIYLEENVINKKCISKTSVTFLQPARINLAKVDTEPAP